MFTGIVEAMGRVDAVSAHRLAIAAPSLTPEMQLGDSVAVNGACLTVVALDDGSFGVDLSEETLVRTNLGDLAPGDGVNLELALKAGGRMGGHVVQGHVDGVGTVSALGGPPEARTLRIELPPELSRYVVEKGFIAADGISLTVTDVVDSAFGVAVIPYTYDNTVLGERKVGDRVNIEVDILAKYVERLLSGQQHA